MSDTDNTKVDDEAVVEKPSTENSINDEVLTLLKGMKEGFDTITARVDNLEKVKTTSPESNTSTENNALTELQKLVDEQKAELSKMQEKIDTETTNTMDFNTFVPAAAAAKADDYETQINKDLQFITQLEVKYGG